ncbi:aminotransferase class V-fold PLP-dependent enzyme [Verrucomicrobiota bacterium]
MAIYLDNAATSRRKPGCVYEAMDRFMREIGASPGRSVHAAGIEASREVAGAREKMAQLFGIADSSRIVFTLNCTEALNTAIKGLLRNGDHVVTTGVEHNSVMRPLSAMMRERGVRVTKTPADAAGLTDSDEIRKAITPRTALVVMTHASNVTGAIQPIEESCTIARECGIPLLVDAAQSAGCLPMDLRRIPIDLLAFSGHKGLMGPQGVGGLYVREGLEITPLKQGGTGSASQKETQPEIMPDRYESGTPNTPGLAGLSAALGFLISQTVKNVRRNLCGVGTQLLEGLLAIDGVTVHGPDEMEKNVGIFSFRLAGHDPGEVARILETRYGIMTRVGLQCAPSAHRSIGTFPEGTVRASISCFTVEEEVQCLVRAVEEIRHG